jgi:EAL domain-containing protein (putative c-di-GMP-specific phosphodiesterase class I)
MGSAQESAWRAEIHSDDVFDRAIAKAVLTLAAELQVNCVAEGVETVEQYDLLRELGCRRFQGIFLRNRNCRQP